MQIGSANLADLWAPIGILEDLTARLEGQEVSNLEEVIGITHNRIPA